MSVVAGVFFFGSNFRMALHLYRSGEIWLLNVILPFIMGYLIMKLDIWGKKREEEKKP